MVPYIIKALQKNESVCVNDLGTFSVHYVPACIVKKEIRPPHNEVTLDTNIDHDEIAFTNFVGMEKRCLLTQANQEIIQWVDELKNALENNKSVSFDDFGTFSLNEKGKISFVCDHIPALNEEFEGMGTLTPGIAYVPEVVETFDEPEPEFVTEPEEEQVIQRSTLLEKDNDDDGNAVEVTEPEEEPVIQRSTLLENDDVDNGNAVEVAEPEEGPVIQRSTLLENDNDDDDDGNAVEVTEPEEEPVIQRSTLLEEEEAVPAVGTDDDVDNDDNDDVVVTEPETARTAEPEPEIIDNPEETTNDEVKIENEEEDNEEENEDDDSSDEVVRKKSLWWLWLLIILLLLAVLGICGYLFRDKLTPLYEQVKNKFSKTEEVVEPEQQQTDEATTDYQETEPEAETVEEEPVPYTPETIKSTADGKYEYIRFENGHFYVIAGSLPNEKDAELHIRQRALDTYEPKLLLQDGVSNIRVCIGIFDTEEEAENYAKGINSKYWVLK